MDDNTLLGYAEAKSRRPHTYSGSGTVCDEATKVLRFSFRIPWQSVISSPISGQLESIIEAKRCLRRSYWF